MAAAAEEAPRETTTGEAGCSTWNKPGHGHKASPHLGRRLSTSPELPGSRRDSGYQGSPLYPSGRGHRTSCSKDSPRQYEDKPPQYDRLRQDEDRPRQYYDKPRQYDDKPRHLPSQAVALLLRGQGPSWRLQGPHWQLQGLQLRLATFK